MTTKEHYKWLKKLAIRPATKGEKIWIAQDIKRGYPLYILKERYTKSGHIIRNIAEELNLQIATKAEYERSIG